MTDTQNMWNGVWVVYGYDGPPYARAQYQGDTKGRAEAFERVVSDGVYEKVAWWPFGVDLGDAINEWKNLKKESADFPDETPCVILTEARIREIIQEELQKIHGLTMTEFANDLYKGALKAMRNYTEDKNED